MTLLASRWKLDLLTLAMDLPFRYARLLHCLGCHWMLRRFSLGCIGNCCRATGYRKHQVALRPTPTRCEQTKSWEGYKEAGMSLASQLELCEIECFGLTLETSLVSGCLWNRVFTGRLKPFPLVLKLRIEFVSPGNVSAKSLRLQWMDRKEKKKR